ncbi:MAG: flagellar basal body rod protein FlgC [Gammaproteobacteria bacterium]|jgi:flagellar basal-body rod protein FlgC|nr:flagellar basal body rod protein FlgC [Gammaproteobacteria bacterium]OUX75759.1 MAG: flagellar basal body rod protein FlgC [Oceanospirillales bacterium TMED59]|tara:strand:+ start:225 stop:647 length:423 start_codon:yes stop_codon:yes gene_type:complete
MLKNIFAIAGTALSAQTIRMNTTASNLANAGSISPTEDEAFRAKRPVFRALVDQADLNAGFNALGGVKVKEVVDSTEPVRKVHDPGNPEANDEGFVYLSNVNEVTEMVEMVAASRSFQNNVEVVTTARQLMMRTLDISKA